MEIVKAEILFSRKCNLSCKHCNMVTGATNPLTVEEWYKGFDNLKKVGCKFGCFYGAEPMLEFNKLKHVVAYAESIGIHTTVITSGIRIPEFRKKVKAMVDMGAKSFSMSFDMLPYCPSSKLKKEDSFHHMKWIRSLPGIRDVAAIATVTSMNYHLLPLMVMKMSAEKIWTFFDLIHVDRGMPGTKCRGGHSTLSLKQKDYQPFIEVLHMLSNMKRQGYLVHTNETFIETIKDNIAGTGSIYDWSCAYDREFPSWLTIDFDGSIYPCDDFHVGECPPKFHELPVTVWDELGEVFRKQIAHYRCKCCWNTHIDAHAVKKGTIPITNYIHGDLNE